MYTFHDTSNGVPKSAPDYWLAFDDGSCLRLIQIGSWVLGRYRTRKQEQGKRLMSPTRTEVIS